MLLNLYQNYYLIKLMKPNKFNKLNIKIRFQIDLFTFSCSSSEEQTNPSERPNKSHVQAVTYLSNVTLCGSTYIGELIILLSSVK